MFCRGGRFNIILVRGKIKIVGQGNPNFSFAGLKISQKTIGKSLDSFNNSLQLVKVYKFYTVRSIITWI